jgi:uncharacterized protein YrrD
MQIKNNAKVTMANGKDAGRIDRVVLDPKSKEVTHVVVRKGFVFTEDKVVPMNLIGSATDEGVVLRSDVGDLKDLPPFEETHYIHLEEDEMPNAPERLGSVYALPVYWYPPPLGGLPPTNL